jgi:hypothetical protein
MPRFIDGIQQADKAKLIRIIIFGLIITTLGLSIMLISRSIADGTDNWVDIQNYENQLNFWNHVYGINEYNARASEITEAANWMRYQQYIFSAVGRVALNVGLLMALIGLFGFSINQAVDDKTRTVCMITACAILILMVFSLGSAFAFSFG